MKKTAIIQLFILLWFPSLVNSQSIVTTVHNLSISGTGGIKATSEAEICIFCHTPHNSRPVAPLWNRNDPGSSYTLYNSSTMQALPGQPDGASILCLSCHDGTIALGNVVSRTLDITFGGGVTTMPISNSNLSTDLSDDHLISFIYNSPLDAQIKYPPLSPIALENDKVQCTSCHDPHKNIYTKFLVATNEYSDLCFKCHDRDYWLGSSHETSAAVWNSTAPDPWGHIEFPYPNVSQNACENCHNPHNAGGKLRLLKSNFEENNCFDCHNGNVAATNIQAQLSKTYIHNVYGYNLIHDPTEPAIVLTQHAECEDCHNPHAVRNTAASAPLVKGANVYVQGVSQAGGSLSSVTNEYELCYRCHADSPSKPASPSARVIVQNNVRLEFDLANPSYHPIAGPGKNASVPSLIAPLTEASTIYCTDCHASDGVGSPSGPHGSIYPQILKYNYNRDGNTWITIYDGYALCYQCHDMAIIFNSHWNIRPSHAQKTSCNTCHDPHGISSLQGNSTNNAYLINFNTAYCTQFGGVIQYIDLGPGSGRCTLRCHNHNHNNSSY
ncbi:MAG: cytochrome c3 family protein [Bacteroidota bacterium]